MAIKDAVRGPIARPRAVYLLATSEDGVAVALKTVKQFPAGQDVELVVLVPHVVPYGIDLARCGHDLTRLGEPYCALLRARGVSAAIRVCACRDVRHLVSQLLVEREHLLIPGRRGRWWRSRDERLARDLACEGHHVQFVDVDARATPMDAPIGPSRLPLRLVRPSGRNRPRETKASVRRDFGQHPRYTPTHMGRANE